MIPPKGRDRSGFTLVELMVVFTIIGIVVVLGLSNYFGQVNQIRLRGDIREFNGALQLAKMRANSTGVAHGVAIERRNGATIGENPDAYIIFMDCNSDGKFTDTDTNISNNSPIASPDVCGTITYDPRIPEKPVIALTKRNYFTTFLGTNAPASGEILEYIIFTPLGQAMRNNTLIGGDSAYIYMQNHALRGGRVDRVGVRIVGGTGMTDLLSISLADPNAWTH